mmetsp:Transcript_34171/g.81774  ORF Transcript_34171/g.81774 Transcript_34171/m.81774 type:complete len:230 (-) Transcript_34171:37-726(-)
MLLIYLPGSLHRRSRGPFRLVRDPVPLVEAPRRSGGTRHRTPRLVDNLVRVIYLPRLPGPRPGRPLGLLRDGVLLVNLPRPADAAPGHLLRPLGDRVLPVRLLHLVPDPGGGLARGPRDLPRPRVRRGRVGRRPSRGHRENGPGDQEPRRPRCGGGAYCLSAGAVAGRSLLILFACVDTSLLGGRIEAGTRGRSSRSSMAYMRMLHIDVVRVACRRGCVHLCYIVIQKL